MWNNGTAVSAETILIEFPTLRDYLGAAVGRGYRRDSCQWSSEACIGAPDAGTYPTESDPPEPSARELRAWARATGLTCPTAAGYDPKSWQPYTTPTRHDCPQGIVYGQRLMSVQD